MKKKRRCGTGGSGCCGPAIDHSSSNMCHGVFAPVCAPEICNVPRIPHHEKLVEGKGYILDRESKQRIRFSIEVEREMQVYKGVFKAEDSGDGIRICAEGLKFFEGDGKTHMLAIFHEKMTNRDIVVTIYQEHQGEQEYQGHQEDQGEQEHQGHQEDQGDEEYQGHQEDQGDEEYQGHQEDQEYQEHQGHCHKIAQVFIYSTSMEAELINVEGELVAGYIKFYVDHNVHEH